MNEKEFNEKLIRSFRHIKLISFEACRLPWVPDLLALAGEPSLPSIWIETKLVNTDQTHIPWRKGQLAWAQDLIRGGGHFFVIVVDRKNNCVNILTAQEISDLNRLNNKLCHASLTCGVAKIYMHRCVPWMRLMERSVYNELLKRFNQYSSQHQTIQRILNNF